MRFLRLMRTFPNTMARRPITHETYAKLVAGFSDAPGNAAHAARVAGCDPRMARRGWELGWPIYSWAGPIRLVVERKQIEAQEKARAEEVERARQAALVKDAARSDALKTHDEEGRLVKVARVNVIQLLAANARLGPALQVLAERMRQAIENGEVNTRDGSTLMRNLAATAASTVRAGQIALELERLHRGDPTQIIGIQPVEMTTDDAIREIEEAQAALTRYQRRGLEVIEGGANADAVGAH